MTPPRGSTSPSSLVTAVGAVPGLADTTQLGGIPYYHVVPGRYDAEGLVGAGKVTALAGGDVTIGGTADAPAVTDAQGNTAAVLCGNIPTSDGTVFVIDKVLTPASSHQLTRAA